MDGCSHCGTERERVKGDGDIGESGGMGTGIGLSEASRLGAVSG